jgi:hypothetical protein
MKNEVECEKILLLLFESKIYSQATENIKNENINEELTLFWRVYCDYIKTSEVYLIITF